VRDFAFVAESNQTFASHKVPQGYSPAEETAGSLTPFGMTISLSVAVRFCCYSKVITSFARACPVARYRIASGTSLNL